jgi:hypothetical protein
MLTSRLSPEEQVRIYNEKAIQEIDLMRKAIQVGDYKLAMHHMKIVKVAIDATANVGELAEDADEKRNKLD